MGLILDQLLCIFARLRLITSVRAHKAEDYKYKYGCELYIIYLLYIYIHTHTVWLLTSSLRTETAVNATTSSHASTSTDHIASTTLTLTLPLLPLPMMALTKAVAPQRVHDCSNRSSFGRSAIPPAWVRYELLTGCSSPADNTSPLNSNYW